MPGLCRPAPYCRHLVRVPQLAHMFLGKVRDGNIGKGTHGIDSSSMLGGRARRTKVGHIRSETRGDMKHSQKHFDVCKVLQYLRGHIPLRVIQDAVLGVSVSMRCETWERFLKYPHSHEARAVQLEEGPLLLLTSDNVLVVVPEEQRGYSRI